MRGIKLLFLTLTLYTISICLEANAGMFISIEKLYPKLSKNTKPKQKNKIPIKLRLEGIISGKSNYAIINGKIYKPSDKISNCKIVKISPQRRYVILKCFGEFYKLKLKEEVKSNER